MSPCFFSLGNKQTPENENQTQQFKANLNFAVTNLWAIRGSGNYIKVRFMASCKEESVQPRVDGTQQQVRFLLALRPRCSALPNLAPWLLVLKGSRSHQPYPSNRMVLVSLHTSARREWAPLRSAWQLFKPPSPACSTRQTRDVARV